MSKNPKSTYQAIAPHIVKLPLREKDPPRKPHLDQYQTSREESWVTKRRKRKKNKEVDTREEEKQKQKNAEIEWERE